MRRFMNTFRAFSFWGSAFFILLILGFHISIRDFIVVFGMEGNAIKLISAYCLLSVIVFLLFNLIGVKEGFKNKKYAADSFFAYMAMVLYPPYKFLDLKDIRVIKRRSHEKHPLLSCIDIYIRRLIWGILWWAIVLLSVYYFTLGKDIISNKLQAFSAPQIVIRCTVFINLYLALLLIQRPLKAFVREIERKIIIDAHYGNSKKMRRTGYYERNPERIPEGCRACGGPYPDCKNSCSMFDD